jgi:predicted PurR-regulated permease PerM
VTEIAASRALFRGALFLIAIVALTLLLHELLWVFVQLFVACIVAAALSPIVNVIVRRLCARRMRWQPQRGLIAVLVFAVACALTVLFAFVVLRAIVQEVNGLITNVAPYQEALRVWLASVVTAFPGAADVDLATWITVNMQVALNGLSGGLGALLSAVGVATSLLGGFLTVVLTVFLALYLTIDAPLMRDYVVVFWPTGRQQQVSRMSNTMAARLGSWVIGQAILCVIIGGGAWLGLQLIGVPYAALLGLVWALAEFVPGIGPFVSAIPSILLGFTVSPATGLAAAAFSLVWSQVESNVITPRVMGNAVELHPLVVLVALIVGSELLGMAGALLAIPVTAMLAVVVDEIRQERLRAASCLPLESQTPT